MNVFVAGACICVRLLFLRLHLPNLSVFTKCMRGQTSVSVSVCASVLSLISSVPAGQFWHLERKTLCIPHGSIASSSELEMGL